MLNIIEHDYCPDGTYFRTGDVEPELKSDGLHVYTGRGSRCSWGTPGNESITVLNDDDLTTVLVGFYHKHGGGQFYRHYKHSQRVEWRMLCDEDRSRILGASRPKWGKIPGKLASERKVAPKVIPELGYKAVAIQDGIMQSIGSNAQPVVNYEIDVTLVETAKPDHQGGYYYYQNVDDAREFGESYGSGEIAIIKVQADGRRIRYDNGKIAASKLTPLAVVATGSLYDNTDDVIDEPVKWIWTWL